MIGCTETPSFVAFGPSFGAEMSRHLPHELLLRYSLECTSPEEDKEVSAHVPGCKDCKESLEEIREGLEDGATIAASEADLFGATVTALFGTYHQVDAAAALGCSKRSVARWEKGERRVTLPTWMALDEVLAIQIHELKQIRREVLARIGKETQ